MRSDRLSKPAGFTLLEVVVALAVVTLGIMAAFNLVVQISTGSLHMKERTLAGWIASNEITRVRLGGEFPDVSQFDGDVEFAGAEYRWRATVSETGVENLRRIDMDVSYADEPDRVIGRSTGFLSPPPAPRLGGATWAAGTATDADTDDEAGPDSGAEPGEAGDVGGEEQRAQDNADEAGTENRQ